MTSIGIDIMELSDDPQLLVVGQTRPTITKSKLCEVSLVDIGANDDAIRLTRNGQVLTCGQGAENALPLLDNNKTKNMQGQTGVLQRVGITFTDAQSKIIKYGTEEQRAATLAQVITDNIGQMNERLAQTDAGKAKQLNNEIGDMKERLGAVFASAEPVITALSEVGMSVFAITNVANGVRGMASAFTVARISQMSGTVATRLDAQAKALLSAMKRKDFGKPEEKRTGLAGWNIMTLKTGNTTQACWAGKRTGKISV